MEKISTIQSNSGQTQSLMNLAPGSKTTKNTDIGFKEIVKKVNPPKLNTKDNFKTELKSKAESTNKQKSEPKKDTSIKNNIKDSSKAQKDTSKGQDTKVNDKDVDKTEAPKETNKVEKKEEQNQKEDIKKDDKDITQETSKEINQNAMVNQLSQINPIQDEINFPQENVIFVNVDTKEGTVTISKTQMTPEELGKIIEDSSKQGSQYDQLIEQISQDPNFKEAWAKVNNGEEKELKIEIPKFMEIPFSMQADEDGKLTMSFKELEDNTKDLFDRGSNSKSNQVQDLSYELNSLKNLDNQDDNNEESNIAISANNINLISKSDSMMATQKASMEAPRTIQNFAEIIDEIRAANKNNKSVIDIKLQPENLGKLSIKINSENGILNASFFVENDKAKQALEMQMSALKQVLQNQGLQIANLDVQLGKGNEDLNRHKNIMEASNYNLKTKNVSAVSEDFEEMVNPYIPSDNEFEDII